MSTCQWKNWAGSLQATPAQCPKPTTVADIQSIITGNPGKQIRAAGTGHSWTPLVPTNSILIDPSGITENGKKAWRWQKAGKDFVTFTPAARWTDVVTALTDTEGQLPQMSPSSAGVIPSINATGFVAAGCHGTGWVQPTVADFIDSIEIVAADGKVHQFSQDTTPNDMPAIRANIGMLGLITKVTLQVEDMFRLWDQELLKPTADVMGPNPATNNGVVDPSKLAAMVTQNDYVELFWFPWSGYFPGQGLSDGILWVKLWNRTQDPIRDVPAQMPDWQIFFATVMMELVAQNPRSDLVTAAGVASWAGIALQTIKIEATKGFVADAPRVFFYQSQAFPVIDLEIAIPIPSTGTNQWDFTNIVQAWYQVVNAVRNDFNNGIYPVNVTLHARFTKNSQSLLSPAYQPAGSETHTCWIEILSAYPKEVQDAAKRQALIGDYTVLRDQVINTWVNQYNGRPHWAKYWQNAPGLNYASLYPAANRSQFNSLRTTLDPNGIFMNDFLTSLNLFG